MQYIDSYTSSLGNILMTADNEGLTGLYFKERHRFADYLSANCQMQPCPVFEETKQWLDVCFSRKEPDFLPSLHVTGSKIQEVFSSAQAPTVGSIYFSIMAEAL